MDNIERALQVTPGGRLTIDSELGSIEVQTVERNKVEVLIKRESKKRNDRRAEELLNDLEITFEQVENSVQITAKFGQGREHWRKHLNRVKVHFEVKIPKKYNVNLKTSAGSIAVADLEGEVRSQTAGGSLRFGAIKGHVWGKTSGGSIKLKGCQGNIEVKTSGGSIEVGDVDGEVIAETSGGSLRFGEVTGSVHGRTAGGSITLAECHGDVDVKTSGGSINVGKVAGDLNAKTSGGSIQAHIWHQPQADCVLETSGGSVVVTLAPDIAVDLDAQTSAGTVTTDFPVTAVEEGKRRENRLKGTINGGGPQLKLRTSGGSIRIGRGEDLVEDE